MQASFGTGPVGTGLYLVGHDRSRGEPQDVDVWLSLLFFPLVPLSRWRVTATASGDAQPMGRTLDVRLHARSRVPVATALRRILSATVVAVLALLPLAFAAWKVGVPWATPVLTALLGSVLNPDWLGKMGMALELGVALAGGAVPILVLMHLDERTPRVTRRG